MSTDIKQELEKMIDNLLCDLKTIIEATNNNSRVSSEEVIAVASKLKTVSSYPLERIVSDEHNKKYLEISIYSSELVNKMREDTGAVINQANC